LGQLVADSVSGGAAPAVTRLVLNGYSTHTFSGGIPYSTHGVSKFKAIAGDVGTLAPLRQLTHLDLGGNAVVGDVGALAPLRQLTHLDLDHTGVTGQAEALAPLVLLTFLSLGKHGHTAVAGCGAFCADGGPFHIHCDPNPDPAWGCYCRC
jgi:hypothetical protein